MKKFSILFVLLICSLSAFAKSAYMLRSLNASLKKKTEKGMVWAMQIPFGAKVDLVSEEPVKAIYYWDGGSSKTEMEFYKVKYQSEEYYITARECAVGDSPVVMVENATMFSKARVSTFKNSYLPIGTICMETGKKVTTQMASFSEVIYYDSNAAKTRNCWVQTKKTSGDEDDIKAAQLVQLAYVQRDNGMKENFMKLALKIDASSQINDYVKDVNRKMFNIIDESNIEEVEFNKALVSVDEGSSVNLRAKPQKGEVVYQLKNLTPVSVNYRTAETDVIDGVTDHWYYVNAAVTNERGEAVSEVVGWIFGGFLIVDSSTEEAEEFEDDFYVSE